MFVRTAASSPFHNLQLGCSAQSDEVTEQGTSKQNVGSRCGNGCGLWFVVFTVKGITIHKPVCGDTNLQEGLCSREFKNTVADGLEAVATSN